MHVAAACSIVLAIHLHPGAHVVERSSFDDRVAWVLPPDRLEAFRRGGVVIDEDMRTNTIATATVDGSSAQLMTLHGTLAKTTIDVPRSRTNHSFTSLTTTITPRNDVVPAQRIDVEDAPMSDLPPGRLCVGQTWRTRIPVMTTLGSGMATIDHTVSNIDGKTVEVHVKGNGVISGAEYNLPRLLPGAIGIEGTALFDPAFGAVTKENYVVRNRLIRTVNAKTIGFLETETVTITTQVTRSAPVPVTDPPRSH